jgi:uncharacterized protein (DUF697 family)
MAARKDPRMAQKSTTPAATQTPSDSDPNKSTSTEIPPEERAEFAAKLVDRFAIWSGVAGLVPVPVVDVIAVGGLQLQMLRRLSQVFQVPFAENRGKSLIASLGGSLIPATSGLGAASALKAVPFVGWIAAGFVMPALSAGATYAIGKAFIQHFTSGGTLLDFNPPDYREFIKAHREMWDSRTAAQGASSQSKAAPDPKTSGAAATGA